MSNKINTGLLAYGMSGKVFHAPFIEHHPAFNFVAVTERNHKNAQQDYPNLKSYASVEALLADDSIELVIINTPNNTHYTYAEMALKAGKHILVEKPFTATTAQAKALFALAKSVGKKALVYQNRRFDSGFNSTKKIIESGLLGQLVEVHFRFDRYRNEIGPKAFKEEPVEASGLQYDLGPHLLDQAIALFGKPEKYYKVLSKNRVGTKVDDYFFIHLSYPQQLHVFLTASMLVAEVKEAFVVNGLQGSFSKKHADVQEGQLLQGLKPSDSHYGIENPADAGLLTLVTENNGRTAQQVPAEKGDYSGLFEAVYQTLRHDTPYPVTEEEVLIQLEILEAAPIH